MISASNVLQQDKTIELIIFSETFGKETHTDFTPFLVDFKMMCLCATLVLESSVFFYNNTVRNNTFSQTHMKCAIVFFFKMAWHDLVSQTGVCDIQNFSGFGFKNPGWIGLGALSRLTWQAEQWQRLLHRRARLGEGDRGARWQALRD